MKCRAWLGVALVCAPVTAAVREVPRPALEAFEPAARAHLEATREQFEEGLARLSGVERTRQAAGYGQLGMVYYGYELNDLAAVAWGNAVELAPEDGRWLYLLGLLRRIEGDWEQARELLARAVAQAPDDAAARIHWGRLLLDLGDPDGAETQFRAVREILPTSAAAALGLARTALATGRYEEAVQWGRRSLALEPQADIAHHQIGLAYRALGDVERARRHLALGRSRDTVIPDPLTDSLADLVEGAAIQAKHGVEAARAGRHDLAIRYFSRAVEIAPDEPSHRYNLAVSLRESGATERAIAELRSLSERFPRHRDGQFNLAALLAQAGDTEGAARHYRSAVEIDPRDRIARIEWAGAINRLGQGERAQSELEALVADDEDDAESRKALATLLAQRGSRAEARAVLSAGLGRDIATQEWVTLLNLRARLAAETGDLEAAKADLEQVLARQPESAASRHDLGRLLAREGAYADAAEHFRRLVEVEPSNTEYQVALALALQFAGDDVALLKVLEEATVSLPQSIELHHLLAQVLAGSEIPQVRDPARALLISQQVMEAEPTVDHGETVAAALAATGDFVAATSWQERVVDERRRAGEAGRAAESAERLERYRAGVKASVRAGDAGSG